ncbi:Serine/threonine-protein kinase cbk1 [Lachnellula cervina]|uniref:non-specific serine/threonine protein kinase n=1 Tax=Lachnellula cervina TaxID=1316786 RepID=A0A7D8UY43_9HELO|nr:Serine/threonine-protein kinase cbk1 [Lachnellula cervina]
MKRTRSKTAERPRRDFFEDLTPEGIRSRFNWKQDLASPDSTEHDSNPAKLRRQGSPGSKLMSALRSWSNSVSSASFAEPEDPPFPASPPGLRRKLSLALSKGQLDPTVVHRLQFKSRPSIISLDKEVVEIFPEGPEVSPSTSAGSSSVNSGKSSVPRPGESTGKTSLDSKFSTKSKGVSQHSSENKKATSKQTTPEGGSNENILTPIAEVETVEAPVPIPSKLLYATIHDVQSTKLVQAIITVEKAAAAKIFFECHYNNLTSIALTPRSLRRRQLEQILYEDTTSTQTEKDRKRKVLSRKESEHLRETRVMKGHRSIAWKGNDITTSKYEVVKVLGKGSFGVVRLVREKVEQEGPADPEKKRDVYAMKVIRKSDMLRNSQEGHLRAERDFLVSAEGSRWVVPLIASFQDLNNLYLVMDYMPGGDFLGLLIRDNILSEPVTKWYIAEMILCIEEAHRLRWIHRDVKPDNFLISASGHLKISDFGLAFDGHWSHDQAYFNNQRYSLLTKLGINVEGDTIDKKEGRTIAAAMKIAGVLMGGKERHDRHSSNNSDGEGILNWRNRNGNRTLARSVVGTSQYMAPEVVRGELYDARCDWWSVAVILYECLYGHTPFLAEEGGRQQTKMNILNHKTTFEFPHKPLVSKRCQDLIRSIIQEKDYRLCCKRYKLRDHLPASSRQNRDHAGRYVLPDDADDIKAHKWFRDIHWDRLHLTVPPFVPNIRSMDDTHYFDEEDPISDFSDSVSLATPTTEEITDALKPFNREIQVLAKGFIDRPHDSARLRKVEREIDAFVLSEEQKDYLKAFVKHYGTKERKRPRDRLLRDKDTAPKVLELRKKGAFLGYTYRRFRPVRGSVNTSSRVSTIVGNTSGKRTVWHRARLSIH